MTTTTAPALTRLHVSGGASVPVLAYALAGKITDADVRTIQADADGLDRLRLLIRVDDFEMPSVSAFTSGLFEMKLGMIGRIERYALVGGPGWIATYVGTVGAMLPLAVKHFRDEADARAWITGPATPDEVEAREEARERAAPAVRLVETHRTDLVALVVDGRLTAADYEAVVDPAIEGALAAHDEVDLLVRVDDLDGFSVGAAREDAALAKHLDHIRRLALVGGPDWMRALAEGAGALVPVEIETFESEAEARAWLNPSA